MKTNERVNPAGLKAKLQTSRKFILPVLLSLSFISANALALGRQNAPCSGFWDCVYTVYHGACNGLCPWY
jgi:hypothetical protein